MIPKRWILSTLAITSLLLSAITSSKSQDLQLQRAVDDALEGYAGAIVVIDVTSQRILASNNLGLAGKRLVRPGSTLKPFVLMELLDSAKLDHKQHLLCRRPLNIGSVRLDCSHTTDVSQLDADDAIAYSCNSYVAEVALRMRGDELVQTLRRAGLDSPTGMLKGEAAGRVQNPANQEQLQLTALGERGIEVTPLELLEAYRKLALRRRTGSISSDEPVFEGLEHAVSYGTAHAAYVDGMRVAGKTGTATAPHNPRTHGLFVGYVPADRPEIGIVVYLPHGRGLDAAMVAHSVLAEYRRLKEKP